MGLRAALLPLLALAACGCGSSHTGTPRDAAVDGSSDARADAEPDAPADAEPDAPDAALTECGYSEGIYGLATGDVLDPFMLWDCEGRSTSLARLWCGQRATIIHISAGWCTVCEEATERLVAEVLVPLEGEPVRLIEIFAEEDPGEVATPEGCRYWSRRFLPPVDVYIPPDGVLEGSLAHLATSGAPPLTVLIDDEGRIREWHRTLVPDLIGTDMERLLQMIREILAEPPH